MDEGVSKRVGSVKSSPNQASVSDCGAAWCDPSFGSSKFKIATKSSYYKQAGASRHEEPAGSGFGEESLERPYFSGVNVQSCSPLILQTDPCIQVPAIANRYLRDYQRKGVQFMFQHFKQHHGCILGDDMGLGKTVQVIVLIAALLGKTGNPCDGAKHNKHRTNPPILIIVPGSVMHNWKLELDRWGYFSSGFYHRLDKEKTVSLLKKNKLEIVITVYETFRDNESELMEFKWLCVIADEIHKIKNKDASLNTSMNRIRTRRRIGLTGTALQNNVNELYNLLSWANPGCLGDTAEFDERYASVIEQGAISGATKRQLIDARQENNSQFIKTLAQEELTSKIKQWMIRRTKGLIADQLPKKEDMIVYCKPTPFQASVIQNLLKHPDLMFVLKRNEPCTCGSVTARIQCCYKTTSDGREWSQVAMSFLHLYLKASNHIAMLLPEHTTSEQQILKSADIFISAFREHPEFIGLIERKRALTLADPTYSGKMVILSQLLEACYSENSKVLLFSYSTTLLDIMQYYIVSRGYSFRRLDGATSLKARHALCCEFNTDKHIFLFLISTKAGGLGLNLTGANVVIIFDPNWNPSTDLQAQDRAYRIGQSKDVRVYRLITAGTIEENMYLRQIYKQLDETVVGSVNSKRYFDAVKGRDNGELFGMENMFTFYPEGCSVTRKVIQRYEKVEERIAGCHVEEYTPSQLQEGDYSQCCDDSESESEMEPSNRPELNGVVHIHRHSKIVGGSRVEDHITHQAIRDVCELAMDSQEIANDCIPQTSVLHNSEASAYNMTKLSSSTSVFYGVTPKSIQRSHFQELADQLFDGDSELTARYVVDSSPQERVKLLKNFYTSKSPEISAHLCELYGSDAADGFQSKKGTLVSSPANVKRDVRNEPSAPSGFKVKQVAIPADKKCPKRRQKSSNEQRTSVSSRFSTNQSVTAPSGKLPASNNSRSDIKELNKNMPENEKHLKDSGTSSHQTFHCRYIPGDDMSELLDELTGIRQSSSITRDQRRDELKSDDKNISVIDTLLDDILNSSGGTANTCDSRHLKVDTKVDQSLKGDSSDSINDFLDEIFSEKKLNFKDSAKTSNDHPSNTTSTHDPLDFLDL